MDIMNAMGPGGPGQQGIANAGQAQQGTVSASADFETFLRMLTVQMQNQNPLNPMESQEFAVQLATFSGVEQQIRSNQLLEALSARMGLSELAGWVGMEALSAEPAWYSGAPMILVAPDVPAADRARLIVKNSFGTEVARVDVDPAAQVLRFDGTGTDGFPLPQGHYDFVVESLRAGDVIATNPALTYSRIHEARFDAGAVVLKIEGGGTVDSAAVMGLRAPEPGNGQGVAVSPAS